MVICGNVEICGNFFHVLIFGVSTTNIVLAVSPCVRVCCVGRNSVRCVCVSARALQTCACENAEPKPKQGTHLFVDLNALTCAREKMSTCVCECVREIYKREFVSSSVSGCV